MLEFLITGSEAIVSAEFFATETNHMKQALSGLDIFTLLLEKERDLQVSIQFTESKQQIICQAIL